MKSPSRIGLVHVALAAFSLALLYRSASVQLMQGSRWTASAQDQQSKEATIPAPRGDILDAHGELMAQSRETVKLEVSPRGAGIVASLLCWCWALAAQRLPWSSCTLAER